MKDDTKIHPTVSNASLDIVKYYGFKPSESIEAFALLLVTNNIIVLHKEQMLLERKKELQDDKKDIENMINDVDIELKNINELKRNFKPTDSKQFDKALHQITLRLRSVMEAEDNNQWNIKRVTLNEIATVCKENNVSIESVLGQVPTSLKRYIENYVDILK